MCCLTALLGAKIIRVKSVVGRGERVSSGMIVIEKVEAVGGKPVQVPIGPSQSHIAWAENDPGSPQLDAGV